MVAIRDRRIVGLLDRLSLVQRSRGNSLVCDRRARPAPISERAQIFAGDRLRDRVLDLRPERLRRSLPFDDLADSGEGSKPDRTISLAKAYPAPPLSGEQNVLRYRIQGAAHCFTGTAWLTLVNH